MADKNVTVEPKEGQRILLTYDDKNKNYKISFRGKTGGDTSVLGQKIDADSVLMVKGNQANIEVMVPAGVKPAFTPKLDFDTKESAVDLTFKGSSVIPNPGGKGEKTLSDVEVRNRINNKFIAQKGALNYVGKKRVEMYMAPADMAGMMAAVTQDRRSRALTYGVRSFGEIKSNINGSKDFDPRFSRDAVLWDRKGEILQLSERIRVDVFDPKDNTQLLTIDAKKSVKNMSESYQKARADAMDKVGEALNGGKRAEALPPVTRGAKIDLRPVTVDNPTAITKLDLPDDQLALRSVSDKMPEKPKDKPPVAMPGKEDDVAKIIPDLKKSVTEMHAKKGGNPIFLDTNIAVKDHWKALAESANGLEDNKEKLQKFLDDLNALKENAGKVNNGPAKKVIQKIDAIKGKAKPLFEKHKLNAMSHLDDAIKQALGSKTNALVSATPTELEEEQQRLSVADALNAVSGDMRALLNPTLAQADNGFNKTGTLQSGKAAEGPAGGRA